MQCDWKYLTSNLFFARLNEITHLNTLVRITWLDNSAVVLAAEPAKCAFTIWLHNFNRDVFLTSPWEHYLKAFNNDGSIRPIPRSRPSFGFTQTVSLGRKYVLCPDLLSKSLWKYIPTDCIPVVKKYTVKILIVYPEASPCICRWLTIVLVSWVWILLIKNYGIRNPSELSYNTRRNTHLFYFNKSLRIWTLLWLVKVTFAWCKTVKKRHVRIECSLEKSPRVDLKH